MLFTLPIVSRWGNGITGLYHREDFAQSARDLGADVPATIAALYRTSTIDGVGKPSPMAGVRARHGWFGPDHRAPRMPRDQAMLDEEDYRAVVSAFERTGFAGANAWYLNDAANASYAAEAPGFGRITVPALFIHAAWDVTCDTVRSRLAVPMRGSCDALTEVRIEAGHEVMKERPEETNRALYEWLTIEQLPSERDEVAAPGPAASVNAAQAAPRDRRVGSPAVR